MTVADFLSRQESSDEMDPNIIGETMNMILQVDLTQLQNEQEDFKKTIDTLNETSHQQQLKRIHLQKTLSWRTKFLIEDCSSNSSKFNTENIIENFHSSPLEGGHLHLEKTLDKIQERYFWKHMRKQVEQFIKTCELCHKRKIPPTRKIGLLQHILPSPALIPFSRIQLHFIGPLMVIYGKSCILSVTDVSIQFSFTFGL